MDGGISAQLKRETTRQDPILGSAHYDGQSSVGGHRHRAPTTVLKAFRPTGAPSILRKTPAYRWSAVPIIMVCLPGLHPPVSGVDRTMEVHLAV